MNGKILFVDDEPHVLQGYQRILHGDFDVHTACSGEEALAEIRSGGPYHVVVSDMSMPAMNGLELLGHVREMAPRTIRVVLTGHADLQTAINALNDDVVFRFLTKPCASDVLKKTLTTCLLQYRLLTAENELLDHTLQGSLKVLTDLFSLANPHAFARAVRVSQCVRHLVRELQLDQGWRYETAAMLSQLGCIALAPEVLDRAYAGTPLPAEQQAEFEMHPAIGCELLATIPRVQGIAWIVGQQMGAGRVDEHVSDNIRTGAILLQVALAFDQLRQQGLTDSQAVAVLRLDRRFDARIVAALDRWPGETAELQSCRIKIEALEPGMIVECEVRSNAGLLLAVTGQEVTYPLMVRLRNLLRRGALKDEIQVLGRASAALPGRGLAARSSS